MIAWFFGSAIALLETKQVGTWSCSASSMTRYDYRGFVPEAYMSHAGARAGLETYDARRTHSPWRLCSRLTTCGPAAGSRAKTRSARMGRSPGSRLEPSLAVIARKGNYAERLGPAR